MVAAPRCGVRLPPLSVLVCRQTHHRGRALYCPSELVGSIRWPDPIAASFLVQPSWVTDWISAVREHTDFWGDNSPYRAIIGFPGGVLALLCLAAGAGQKRALSRRSSVCPSPCPSTKPAALPGAAHFLGGRGVSGSELRAGLRN